MSYGSQFPNQPNSSWPYPPQPPQFGGQQPKPGPDKSSGAVLVILLLMGLGGIFLFAVVGAGMYVAVKQSRVPQMTTTFPTPTDGWTRYQVALGQERFDEALAGLDEWIASQPNAPTPINDKAWLLATCPDERFRDGTQAVELATRANQLSNYNTGAYLDTLAAAHAEAGDFENAVKWQREAIACAKRNNEMDGGYQQRLQLFESRQPYRTPSVRHDKNWVEVPDSQPTPPAPAAPPAVAPPGSVSTP